MENNLDGLTITAMAFAITILWKIVSFLFDMLVKKHSKKDEQSEEKIDKILQVVTEQNLKIEALSSKLEHGYEGIQRLERKEDELRAKFSEMREALAELKEWKRNTVK